MKMSKFSNGQTVFNPARVKRHFHGKKDRFSRDIVNFFSKVDYSMEQKVTGRDRSRSTVLTFLAGLSKCRSMEVNCYGETLDAPLR